MSSGKYAMVKNFSREDIGIRIKEVRGSFTYQVFATKVGSSAGFISDIEKGIKKPSPELLYAIAKEFGINLNWLLTGEGDPVPNIPGAFPADLTPVTVYGPVGAGTAKEIWERPIGRIYVLKQFHKPGMNAVLVAGNSMEPTIMDRAYALCLPGAQDIIDNKIYVVYLRDIGNVLKRLFKLPGRIVLKSDNPAIPAVEVDPKDIVIQGKVVGTIQEL